MAAQRPLLRGQRLKTTGQMKAIVKDAMGLYLGGQYPYVNVEDLVDALSAADPKGKSWNRQRLDYSHDSVLKPPPFYPGTRVLISLGASSKTEASAEQ
jgi:hypothetical protein